MRKSGIIIGAIIGWSVYLISMVYLGGFLLEKMVFAIQHGNFRPAMIMLIILIAGCSPLFTFIRFKINLS